MFPQRSKRFETSGFITQILTATGKKNLLFAPCLTIATLLCLSLARADDPAREAAPSPTPDTSRNLKIEPSEIQPKGIITITTETPVTIEPNAVSVGGVAAVLLDPPVGNSKTFRVQLAEATPIGQKDVVVATKDGYRFGSVIVDAVIDSVKATAETGTGVLAGGTITLQTVGILPQYDSSIRVQLTSEAEAVSPSASPSPKVLPHPTIKDNQITVSIPDHFPEGRYRVEVSSSSAGAPIKVSGSATITVHSLWRCFILAISPTVLVGIIILYLGSKPTPKKRSPTGKRYRWFALLFLEEENNTYSLSRAQFVAWLTAITTAYVFLFITRGLIDNTWVFPPLAGFAYTFLLSLGTLVVAQGTNTAKGCKGAGSMDPKIADLVLNGDVLALDRVQQLVWTIISIGIFLWITFKGYVNSNTLPTVPQEMLTLMGISSAGYLAGKFARRPGPIIQQITSDLPDSIKISGSNLSRDAFVWIDGAQVAKDAVSVSEVEPDYPNEFARSLAVKLVQPAQASQANQANPPAPVDIWRTKSHDVAVVNSDGQRAEWTITVPQITEATAAQTGTKYTISIKGTAILTNAVAQAWNPVSNMYVTISDFKPASAAADPAMTTSWTGRTDFKPSKVMVTNPNNQRAEVNIP